MDVARARPRFSSRGMKLRRDGKGWSQLTRALEAPTLFGQHFGEILEPASAVQDGGGCAACHWNYAMPPGRDLLAVQMEDIREASKKCDGCGRLHFADRLCLDVPSLLFEPCRRDNSIPACQNRIVRVQSSANVQTSTGADAYSKAGVLSKEWLDTRWSRRKMNVENTDNGLGSSSATKMATTGAILLGMSRESPARMRAKKEGTACDAFSETRFNYGHSASPHKAGCQNPPAVGLLRTTRTQRQRPRVLKQRIHR